MADRQARGRAGDGARIEAAASGDGDQTSVKRYSAKQVERTLAKYETEEVEVPVGDDLHLRMVETADAYALLDSLIEREAGGARITRFPYWAEIWPAALALARWFAQAEAPAPDVARELGCGIGVVGIALARMGWQVEATDYVEDALVFATHNARRNGVGGRHQVSYLDWSHPVGRPVRTLVGSDVAYEKTLHPYLQRTVRALLEPGGQLILSDPGRPAAQPLFASLEGSGFAHRKHELEVTWQALTHQVDVHAFIRPA